MSVSKEIQEAISEFLMIDPDGWGIDPQPQKNIYAQVRIDGWPSVVHYEFRYNQETGLYVELHAEHQQYSFLVLCFLCAWRKVGRLVGIPFAFLRVPIN
ncbi:hypothetical protein GPA27_26300 [Aromatoleum toluolicum]|uniref:Uncharacterized protein n=1 Tax=Aromatoleum toluolicum TaxID=90060 RepID=A0ABX1NPD9_9RHOO|nr:hypothetical protein [Aromatoleum toluolicum]NMG00896.1 hypothetical protein [Aromatoleum toluolicum]